jgi:hypothetical protein
LDLLEPGQAVPISLQEAAQPKENLPQNELDFSIHPGLASRWQMRA